MDTLGMLLASGAMPLATLASSSTDGRDLLRWTDAASGKMSDLPHARGGAAVARWELASQQLLYMYGGCSIVQCYDGLMRLDLYRGKWTTEQVKGTPPKKRKGHTLNLLGRSLDEQVLLVIGGWSGDGVVPNGIKEYSIIHNQWQYRAFQGTPPPDRWAHTATSIDPEHVIVFGGEGTTPGQYLNDVYLFSLLEGEWRRLHPQGDERFGAERLLPAGRMGHTATLIKTPTSHALYIFGGYTTAARGTRQVSAGAAHAQCPARSRMGGVFAEGGRARVGRWSACPLPVVAPLLAPLRPPPRPPPLAPRARAPAVPRLTARLCVPPLARSTAWRPMSFGPSTCAVASASSSATRPAPTTCAGSRWIRSGGRRRRAATTPPCLRHTAATCSSPSGAMRRSCSATTTPSCWIPPTRKATTGRSYRSACNGRRRARC